MIDAVSPVEVSVSMLMALKVRSMTLVKSTDVVAAQLCVGEEECEQGGHVRLDHAHSFGDAHNGRWAASRGSRS